MLSEHQNYLKQCFDIALEGCYHASPNPFVGAILVKDNKIIGRGAHLRFGQAHAEVNAINNATEDVAGATLYCSLEPCCHTNKQTPPCTQLIINSKIKKVVISNLDPNPEVAGKGVETLRSAGIEVTHDKSMSDEGAQINAGFFKRIKTNQAYIHLKWAQTLDGKIALDNGESKWITNESSREQTHFIRMLSDAIITSAKTIRDDNPSFTARYKDFTHKQLKVFILTNSAQLDISQKIFESPERVCIVTNKKSRAKLEHFAKAGVEILTFNKSGNVELKEFLNYLNTMKFNQIMVEGGSSLISQFIELELYDQVSVFIAPAIMGRGKSATEHLLSANLNKMRRFKHVKWKNLQGDLYFTAIKG